MSNTSTPERSWGNQLKRSLSHPEKMLLFGHRKSKSFGWEQIIDRTPTKRQANTPTKRTSRRKQLAFLIIGVTLAYCILLFSEHRRLLTKCENKLNYGFNSSEEIQMSRHGPRVVIVTGAYNNVVDGVAKTLNRLVKDLQQEGYRVYIIAPTNDPPAMEHYGALLPAPSMKIPFRNEYSLTTGLDRCIQEFLEHFDPEIVHVASPDLIGWQIQRWALERRTPVTCSYHTRFNSYLPYYFSGRTLDAIDSTVWWWMVKIYRQCDHVYPPTLNVQKELVGKGFPNETMRIWPRGINLTSFNPLHRNETLRAEWGANNNTVVILLVTRMVWEKNLKFFVDTINGLMEQYPNAPIQTVVCGDGPALPEVQRLLPNATYMGHTAGGQLSLAYASADIFFFPSITETWGSVTLEAMASGLAVVVPGGPSGSELIQDNVTGIRYDPTNTNGSIAALVSLTFNRTLRRKLAVQAVSSVRNAQDFTWEHANQMLRGHYMEILSRPPIASLVGGMWDPPRSDSIMLPRGGLLPPDRP
eukprot:m.99867 g.99867  ORF g.99867 m.99867 type:complete len:527 (+) comp27197_c0_seq3:395-1975(+)